MIFVIFNILTIKPNCSVCLLQRPILQKDVVVARTTMIILESPQEDKILGVWLVSENKENASLMVYYIPWWVYVYDYSGSNLSSRLSISNLKYASTLVSPDRYREYTIWQLVQNIGLPINDYIWIDSNNLNNYSNIYGDIAEFSRSDISKLYINDISNESLLLHSFMSRFSSLSIFTNYNEHKSFFAAIESNMNTYELIRYITSLRDSLSVGGINSIDVSLNNSTSEIYDSSLARNVSVINTQVIDAQYVNVLSKLKSREYNAELSRVEVYNGSDISGLAFRYKRLLSNNGINVIRYDNAPDIYERTTVYITNDKFPITKDVIIDTVGSDVEIINANPSFITTGDFVVVLGKDIGNKIEWK